jgi:methyl coenzyme M reductase alpha subunit
MVYCTGGHYPQPRKPEFSARAENLIGKYGCAHYKSDPCACPCHRRKKTLNDKGEK